MSNRLRIFLLCLCLFLNPTVSTAQQPEELLEQAQALYQSEALEPARTRLLQALAGLQGEPKREALCLLAQIALDRELPMDAIGLLEQANEISVELSGTKDVEAEALLAQAYYDADQPTLALESYRHTVELTKSQSTLFDQASAIWNLADFLDETGQTEEAAEWAYRAFTLYDENGFAEEALEVIETLSQWAERDYSSSGYLTISCDITRAYALKKLSRHKAALALGLQSAKRAEATGYTDLLGAALANLCESLNELGRYSEAAEAGRRAVTLFEREYGQADSRTADALSNLAHTLSSQERLSEARETWERVIKIRRQVLGSSHPLVARAQSNYASLLIDLSDYEDALSEITQAVETLRKAGPEFSMDLAAAVRHLSAITAYKGRTKETIRLREEVLAVWRVSLPAGHPLVATALSGLAEAYTMDGRPEEALPLLKESLELLNQRFGSEHDRIAFVMGQIAENQRQAGRFQEAIHSLGTAVSINASKLPLHHVQRQLHLQQMARLQLEADDDELALAYARKADASLRSGFSQLLTFSSDFERLAYRDSVQPYDLFCQLGAAPDILRALLSYKAIVLDSLIRDLEKGEKSRNVAHHATWRALKAAQREWSELIGKPEGTLPRLTQQLAKVEKLQRELATMNANKGAGAELEVDIAAVRDGLRPDEALVEFVEFRALDGVPMLGAVLLENSTGPRWAVLGSTSETRTTLAKIRRATLRHAPNEYFNRVAVAGYDRLWKPINGLMSDNIKRVFISPAGPLNFESFACFLEPGGTFLGERLQITYLVSGRDLLARPSAKEVNHISIFGNPICTGRTLFGSTFDDLPYTTKECEAIEALALEGGLRVEKFLGSEATEDNLRGLRGPDIVHLATHGYFLQNSGRLGSSGLVLSRSQAYDGFSSALEVAGLELGATQLIVLSACSTGLGDLGGGEVQGLRRSFREAGVKRVLLTLWPISDRTTSEFMAAFYQELFRSGQVGPAFHKTQRQWLKKLREEQGSAAAAHLIGPFVLSR